MNELMTTPQSQMTTQEAVEAAMAQYMAPMIATYNAMTEAMGQMAQSMRAIQENMDVLRRESLYRTPLSGTQKRHLNAAIRERAEGVAAKRCLPPEAVKDAVSDIRRKLCRRWGVRGVGDIPTCEYTAAMETVEYWDETDLVMRYL